MRKWAVIVLGCIGLLITEARGSHIVGGEFELIHLSGTHYRLNMILYFDLQNGNPGAQDPFIEAAFFRKKDNAYLTTHVLPFISSTRVDYFQPSCSNGEVETNKLIYSKEIDLTASSFNDPEGYYIAWERCCRNYTITNVDSNDPAVGVYAGQTFYLEFPPVVKDGEPFVNSSPILFPPLNDYACPYRPYWVDFKGTDPDGDSLVYSIVTPLNTHSGVAAVPGGANPGPYPPIHWESGFNLNNIMRGVPDLEISTDGFLTVTPAFQGLYVFAVKVDEYRDGEKIGEVRRDFQLLVVDKCPEAEAPVIKGKKLTDGSFTFRENMSVTFPYTTSDEDRCVEVQVTDLDAMKAIDDFSENVSIKAIPLGFKEDVEGLLPEDIQATLVNGSDATFQICFDECPYLRSGSFNIGIVVFDDACALPLSDTLRINVFVEPPPNVPAYFVDGSVLNLTVNEEAGGLLTRDILARDNDGDSLSIFITPIGFNPSDFGITLNPGANTPGEVEALLEWNYDCQEFSFDGQTEFPFLITVDDKDQCQFADPATLNLNMKINLPPNTIPDVNISSNPTNDDYHYIEQKINSTLAFNVLANDVDNDRITLNGAGINFNFSAFQIDFPEKEGDGLPGIQSNFSWDIPCNFNLTQQDSFRLHFYTEDFDKCQITNQDTIIVDVKLLPEVSTKPLMSAFALGETVLEENNSVYLMIGETVSLRLVGADSDPDILTLSLLNPENFTGIDFPPVTNRSQVSSTFSWTPDCNILGGRDSVTLQGHFQVMDDNCYLMKGDTLSVDIKISDTEDNSERFRPPNVITPNGDSHNEFFTLEKIFDPNGVDRSMPDDNCAGRFKQIEIFNRWGKKVYASQVRDFKWVPDKEPAGIYYYYVEYTNQTYKGVVSIFF